MAQLTTAAGAEITFDPTALTAVAEREADTGDLVTTVYGLGATALPIAETPHVLLSRLGLSRRFAQLTRPDGSAVWIAGPAVISLRPPLPGEYAPGVNTVVVAGLLTQGVEETPNEARTRLNAAQAVL